MNNDGSKKFLDKRSCRTRPTTCSSARSQIITKPTDAMVSIEGENMRPVTSVAIEEVRRGEWGIDGRAATGDAVHAAVASFFVFGCF